MDEKLYCSSFGRGHSCAQHIFKVQNYAGKLQKKLADNQPKRGERISGRVSCGLILKGLRTGPSDRMPLLIRSGPMVQYGSIPYIVNTMSDLLSVPIVYSIFATCYVRKLHMGLLQPTHYLLP
jgi:hypothetical protein